VKRVENIVASSERPPHGTRQPTHRANLLGRLRRLTFSRRRPWTLILPAVAVFGLATTNSARIPGAVAAVALSIGCLASSTWVAVAIVVVASNDPHLFRDGAFGAITPVDLAIASCFFRAAFSAVRRPPTRLEWCALGFLLAGAAATVVARQDNATTAFARVASYLILGLAVGRALDSTRRVRVAQAFVGAAAGQATAALVGVTPTTPTSFPIGRYLGTLGDPAQFGIPVALAGVLVGLSSNIIQSRPARYVLLGLFSIGVAGSVTRSAWAVLGTAFLVAAILRASRGKSTTKRLMFAAGGVAVALAATASVILGARTLGLSEHSARVRSRSLHAAWTYLAEHPARPIGLGTPAAVTLGTGNGLRVVASTFETTASRWLPYGAEIRRDTGGAFSGTSALRIATAGDEKEEGAGLSVGGMEPNSPYTLSVDAKVAISISLWFYVDEYDHKGRWLSYKYTVAKGQGSWRHYSWTWRTNNETDNIKFYVLSPRKQPITFRIDNLRLDRGNGALPFDGEEKLPPETISVSKTYNTWLSLAIHLGVAAALLFAALAVGAPYNAYRLGDRATSLCLGALLVPSMTEDFIYGTSLVTLIWLGALGLTAAASRPHATEAPPGEESS
jgi:hypothetical protein